MTVFALLIFAVALFIAGRAVIAIARAWSSDDELDTTLEEDMATREVRELLSRKTMLMQLIQQTENDLAVQRIEKADAERVIQRYRREAVQVLRRLDALQGTAEDIARARELIEERRDQAFARYQAGEATWSPVAARRHGTLAPKSEGANS